METPTWGAAGAILAESLRNGEAARTQEKAPLSVRAATLEQASNGLMQTANLWWDIAQAMRAEELALSERAAELQASFGEG